MEGASSVTTSQAGGKSLELPRQSLIVLCGPAGSGKSTFAHRFVERHTTEGCRTTSIVSSDYCRALISDDAANQQINRDAFDLFYYILQKRLFHGALTIADSTALQIDARRSLLNMAHRYQYTACLVVFNVSLQTCIQHDLQADRGRVVGEQVIRYHSQLLQRALIDIKDENWDQVIILDEQQMGLDFHIT